MTSYDDEIIDPITGRPMCFDKTGQPISLRQWGALRWKRAPGAADDGRVSDYARIGDDEIGGSRVSTVWLGLDHGVPELLRGLDRDAYRPVIFETMIFGGEYDDAVMRYHSEAEAAAGHARAVADLRAGPGAVVCRLRMAHESTGGASSLPQLRPGSGERPGMCTRLV